MPILAGFSDFSRLSATQGGYQQFVGLDDDGDKRRYGQERGPVECRYRRKGKRFAKQRNVHRRNVQGLRS
jgi:hypothetical protein